MNALRIEPLDRPPDADLDLPGSKSITNRAMLCAALAPGTSMLPGRLVADDTEAMSECLRRLGARVDGETVVGTGGEIQAGPVDLDVREAGTAARFLTAVVATGEGGYMVDGAEQMRRRPMAPLLGALRALGATIRELGEPGCLPLVVEGRAGGGRIELSGDVSSQFLSALMLAGPLMAEGVDVRLSSSLVSRPYVAMTARVMKTFGAMPDVGDSVSVDHGGYTASTCAVEPDATAASYFFAAAAITGGRVSVRRLSTDSVQGDVGFVDHLEAMGARVDRRRDAVEVTGTGDLHGVDADMADLSDTAPTLAVTAAFADSPTTIRGVGFIRRKESDRIAAVVRELGRCGIDAEERPDGLVVQPGTAHGARIETYEDHRMAMSFSLIGLKVPGIEILNPGCVAKTFPSFFSVLDELRR